MRDFTNAKRIVVKIGTNILTKGAAVDAGYVRRVAGQVNSLLKDGRQVVIISSGAIGMGVGQLSGLVGGARNIKMRQACAAIGQPLLMAEYRKSFLRYGVTVAQVLLTAEVLNHRKTYLNLRNSIETLLKLSVVPILNENDSVSTDEIGSAFGDNDKLSALVASKIDADLLIMLSDIDALYDKNPRKFADARPIPTVFEITDDIVRNAGGKGSRYSTGGMKTKIEAAKIASNAGCRIVLADGRLKNVIGRIIAGEEIGTIFMPKRKLSNRARWILNSIPAGTIVIDAGAMRAVRNRKSLLPSGVIGVEGSFEPGAVVMLNDSAKAVASIGSVQLRTLAGKHSTETKKLLGPKHRDVVAIPEDIVIIDTKSPEKTHF
ncbi:MAG: glutamate 5-kinase [Planctomycetota bacterium]|jgi:glutamate 5-kinase